MKAPGKFPRKSRAIAGDPVIKELSVWLGDSIAVC